MTTWSDQGYGGDATTTWNYHPQRGWLENKRYHNSTGPDYTYTAAGRLKTRTWARQVNNQPLVATYTYNEAGDLSTVIYSDDTPSVTHTHERLGRLATTEDAAGLLIRDYTPAGLLEYEDYTGTGLLSGVSVDRGYDSQHRLRHLATKAGYGATYLFDSAGRLSQIAESHHWADLAYETGTTILDSVTIRRVGTPRLSHERLIDKLGRIEWVKTTIDGATAVRREYTHNPANQRTLVEHEDGRAWHYGYDGLGQVASAAKRLSTDPQSAILPGYEFGYQFDDIGNRKTATRNSRLAVYTPDPLNLNQYEERDIPGYIDVLGEALPAATVTVNSSPTQRTAGDFRREVAVDNTAGPVHSEIIVEAEIDSQVVDETRWAFLSKDPEVFSHDLDGNLESDGRWTYEWDAENRLKAMETQANVATLFPALKQRLEFAYDFQGRRIQKVVKEWDTGLSGWEITKDLRFIYDGWNLIEERDALDGDAVVRKHVWGPDLSGTMQGAGGVGGLLWTQTPTQTFASSSDANGNVVAWINTATLAVAGRTDYSPFGEPLMLTGVAKELPFGFSTKYEDVETDLLYYGLRYQNPATGRFLNRDPIEERGGLNLYAFVENDAINKIDHLGLYSLNFVYMFAPPFSDYRGGDGFTWSQSRKNAVISAHLRARQFSENLLPMVSRYLQEIPEIYCETRGRKILEREVAYAERTISEAHDAMYSGRRLDVGPAVWSGKPEENRGAYLFVHNSSSKLWVLDQFFGADLDIRASKFFHEVTHLIGRTPDDDAFKVGGWHKTGRLYELLLLDRSYGSIINRFEGPVVSYINMNVIGRGCTAQWIIRKDGQSMTLQPQ